jgi:hypothetical protein
MKQRNNLLLKRPIGRPHVVAEMGNESRLVVHHNHWISKLCTRFFRTPAQTYFNLDSYGSFVWSHCNGEYTVGDIARLMSEEFGTEADPVMERLIVFFRILIGRKLIILQD